MRSRPIPLSFIALCCLLVAGCSAAPGGGGPTTEPQSASEGAGHGVRADAAEEAEPQLALTGIGASGLVTHLDLLDGSTRELGRIGAPASMHTDGRYLFVGTDRGLEIVDSGVWTWDHGDHFHYYRGESRILDPVPGRGPVSVATTTQSTSGSTGVFFAASGDAVLLDTGALSRGEVKERFRLRTEPHAGMVVPAGDFALVTEADGGSPVRVSVYTHEGEPTGESAACADASGSITTRVGAVIGCRDGALLATVADGALSLERIPYPAGTTAPPATGFANREGRPVVAALAGPDAVWLLDTRARTWTLVPSPTPLIAVTAVDDERGHLLALARDGRMLVLDPAGGAPRAVTDPLVSAPAEGGAPALIADQQRAYVGGAGMTRLYEIDFADGARIARTFDGAEPLAFVAETGR